MSSILFYMRWRNAEARARSKAVEANHEAWICTRVALSLIGMAPIARWRVSAFIIINEQKNHDKIKKMTKNCNISLSMGKEKKEGVLLIITWVTITTLWQNLFLTTQCYFRYAELLGIYRRLSNLELRYTKESRRPSINGTATHSGDSSDAVKNMEKLRRLRRLFVQFDFDACVVALANACLGAGPFAIAQGVLYLRRLLLNRQMPPSTCKAAHEFYYW